MTIVRIADSPEGSFNRSSALAIGASTRARTTAIAVGIRISRAAMDAATAATSVMTMMQDRIVRNSREDAGSPSVSALSTSDPAADIFMIAQSSHANASMASLDKTQGGAAGSLRLFNDA